MGGSDSTVSDLNAGRSAVLQASKRTRVNLIFAAVVAARVAVRQGPTKQEAVACKPRI